MDYAVDLGRRERKRLAVHQTLLDAAAALFAEQGVAHTTVDDIAEAADVARQTVFNHFPYKEAFALELAADSVYQISLTAEAMLDTGSPALEVLEHAARRLLAISIEQGERAAVVARELLHTDSERAARAAECVPLQPLFQGILHHARAEGSIRNDLPLDIAASRVSAIMAGILAKTNQGDAALLWRDLTVCLDILFYGITERR